MRFYDNSFVRLIGYVCAKDRKMIEDKAYGDVVGSVLNGIDATMKHQKALSDVPHRNNPTFIKEWSKFVETHPDYGFKVKHGRFYFNNVDDISSSFTNLSNVKVHVEEVINRISVVVTVDEAPVLGWNFNDNEPDWNQFNFFCVGNIDEYSEEEQVGLLKPFLETVKSFMALLPADVQFKNGLSNIISKGTLNDISTFLKKYADEGHFKMPKTIKNIRVKTDKKNAESKKKPKTIDFKTVEVNDVDFANIIRMYYTSKYSVNHPTKWLKKSCKKNILAEQCKNIYMAVSKKNLEALDGQLQYLKLNMSNFTQLFFKEFLNQNRVFIKRRASSNDQMYNFLLNPAENGKYDLVFTMTEYFNGETKAITTIDNDNYTVSIMTMDNRVLASISQHKHEEPVYEWKMTEDDGKLGVFVMKLILNKATIMLEPLKEDREYLDNALSKITAGFNTVSAEKKTAVA